jgi:uncharacterized membrane protein YbhN (UPF0104 family)
VAREYGLRPSARSHPVLWWIGIGAGAAAAFLMVRTVDAAALRATWTSATSAPGAAAAVILLYALAFVIRALLWTRVLPRLSFGHALAAIHVSLGGNHVLPLRLGEALRVTSVVRRCRIPLAGAAASTVMLRAADIVAVVGLAAVVGPQVVTGLVGRWAWALLVPAAALWVGGLWWLRRVDTDNGIRLGRSVGIVAAGTTFAWVLESAVIWQASRWAGIPLSPADAILVTAVTIAAQVVAIAPAGLGTYEAAATAALVALGAPAGAALAAALTAHAMKTAYALVTGAVALFVPGPGAFGRLRLSAAGAAPPSHSAVAAAGAPILLFLPAHNEEASVGGLVARAPSTILEHPVHVLVVDDGSSDDTAADARAAGAEVISFGENRGLGAAVRVGLAEGVRRRAAAVAFCDADGEYAPEELGDLVRPVLDGSADYVVGSRFEGTIGRMRPHRRLGNLVLTRLLGIIARRRISDGQSGYRAFSLAAAADAEIIHDFNYAQILTLDLLAKGYRYHEVPISYRFRDHGESFVRLGTYLRRVVPAIYREVNTT